MAEELSTPAGPREAMASAMREFMARAVLFQDAVARSVGLNSSDLQAVGLLMSGGPASPSELAQRIGMTQGGAITGLIDRLVQAGYVTRQRDTHDRRRVLVVADQDKVVADVGHVYGLVSDRWDAYLATLTPEEIAVGARVIAAAARLNQEETERLRQER